MKSKNFRKISLYLYLLLFSFFAVLIITNPEIGKKAAVNGILLCGRVIIPSLFTFSALTLFLMKTTPYFAYGKEKIFIIFFSLTSGYPIGAKLINNSLNKKIITEKEAKKMLNYCVNAGPAFIISAVGCGILSSKKIGYILFISHILSSIIIAFLLNIKKSKTIYTPPTQKQYFSFIDSFTQSVSEASSMILGVCGYVIFFSVLNDYLIHFGTIFPFLKNIAFFLEVTRGIIQSDNIYFISFLLGFSGFCIWCQVLSIGKDIKINPFIFAFFRIIHGILSSIITYLFIKIFKITLPCFSNSVEFNSVLFYSTPIFSLSLLSLGIIFIISLFTKKYSGNFLEDIL